MTHGIIMHVTLFPYTAAESTSTADSTNNELTSNTVTVVVTSLVSVFLVSSVIIFIIGFICGHCFGRKSNKSELSKTETPVPPYEDVLPRAMRHQVEEHDLEMNENVAYGPSRT